MDGIRRILRRGAGFAVIELHLGAQSLVLVVDLRCSASLSGLVWLVGVLSDSIDYCRPGLARVPGAMNSCWVLGCRHYVSLFGVESW